MSKNQKSEIKNYEEFREKMFNAGDILDSSAEVIANLVAKGLLEATDMLKLPIVIIEILKKVESEKEDNENGTEED